MNPDESTTHDSASWVGDRKTRASASARTLIVLFYALVGPLVGAFWLLVGDAVYTGQALHIGGTAVAIFMAALVLIPYSIAFIPALITGIAVAHFTPSRAKSSAAALFSPMFVYALVYPTGGFAGAKLAFGSFPLIAILGIAMAASLTCWLLTLPIQRRT